MFEAIQVTIQVTIFGSFNEALDKDTEVMLIVD